MLKASQAEDGKALNALDLPRAIESDFPRRFSSDVVAWDLLQGDEFCRDQYPMSFLRWGLCATAGAYHREHMDCEGGGTFIGPESGVKIWLTAVPADGYTYEDFAGIDLCMDLVHPAENKLMKWVALVLKAGTTL